MSRFSGRWSLAAAVLCAGLVHAEPANPAKKPADTDKVMTITDGTKTHKCDVMRSYKHPSGGIAYEVKVQDTGEVMTVIEEESAAPAVAAKPSASPAKADPIMQPKQYIGSPRVKQQLFGDSAKCEGGACQAEAKYGKAPTPATKRWFGNKAEVQRVEAVAPAAPIEAVRHSDPAIRLIGSLRDEVMPSMREVAAMTLARSDARSRPEVVAALSEAADCDPAPSVRECCARCLAEMGVR